MICTLEVTKNLDSISKDLSLQLNALDEDMNSLHKHIIQLGVKYPEQQELIEFIVFINDRLGTRHSQVEDIMSQTISDLISCEKQMVVINEKLMTKIDSISSKKGFWSTVGSKISSVNDIKVLFGLGFVVSLVIARIFFPESSSEFLADMINITIGKK